MPRLWPFLEALVNEVSLLPHGGNICRRVIVLPMGRYVKGPVGNGLITPLGNSMVTMLPHGVDRAGRHRAIYGVSEQTETEGSIMYANLASAQSTFSASPEMLDVKRSQWGGSAMADLMARMHAEDTRCAVCALPTRNVSGARIPEAARLLVLIPCSMLDEVQGEERLGYVAGNVALACHACVHTANTYARNTGAPVVFTADCLTLPGNVWLTWPKGLGSKRRPAKVSDHSEDARLARQANGLPF